MEKYSCLYLLTVNLMAFCLMGVDKSKAKKGQWRIPEKTLFLCAAIGGSLGAILGMNTFRHKTKHASFRIGLPAILLIQVALFGAGTYWYYFAR